ATLSGATVKRRRLSVMTILPEQGVLLSSRLRFRRSSSARPQDHVHISRSPFNQRGDSIRFSGFTGHDADENGAFVELQGFGVHGHNQVPLWQFWNLCKGFHRKLVNGSEAGGKKDGQQAGCPGSPESPDRTGDSQTLLNVVLIQRE